MFKIFMKDLLKTALKELPNIILYGSICVLMTEIQFYRYAKQMAKVQDEMSKDAVEKYKCEHHIVDEPAKPVFETGTTTVKSSK